jgi:hypothetical protein
VGERVGGDRKVLEGGVGGSVGVVGDGGVGVGGVGHGGVGHEEDGRDGELKLKHN